MQKKTDLNALKLLLQEHGGALGLYKATGIVIPFGGGAKGYNEVADIPIQTIDGVSLNDLWDEVRATVALLNRQRNPLIERLTFRVDKPVEGIPQLEGDEFEEADEFGQPKGIRMGPVWNLGFNLRYFDLGIRYTYRFLGESTAEQVRALNNAALEADQRLIYKTILTQVFDNRRKQHTLSGGTAVTVYPFYNGALETLPQAPPKWKTYAHTTTHNHYLVSGAATVDSGDLDEMYDHLHHHGYTLGAAVILLVNRKQANTIRTFRVSTGARNDFIPKAGTVMFGSLIGQLPPSAAGLDGLPGFIGMYGDVAIVEEDYVPPDYMFMFASGGERAPRNPVGLREHENPSLRGLKIIPRFERYPLAESFYHHALGSGVAHPGAGVVMQVKAAGTYDIPAIETQGPGGR